MASQQPAVADYIYATQTWMEYLVRKMPPILLDRFASLLDRALQQAKDLANVYSAAAAKAARGNSRGVAAAVTASASSSQFSMESVLDRLFDRIPRLSDDFYAKEAQEVLKVWPAAYATLKSLFNGYVTVLALAQVVGNASRDAVDVQVPAFELYLRAAYAALADQLAAQETSRPALADLIRRRRSSLLPLAQQATKDAFYAVADPDKILAKYQADLGALVGGAKPADDNEAELRRSKQELESRRADEEEHSKKQEEVAQEQAEHAARVSAAAAKLEAAAAAAEVEEPAKAKSKPKEDPAPAPPPPSPAKPRPPAEEQLF